MISETIGFAFNHSPNTQIFCEIKRDQTSNTSERIRSWNFESDVMIFVRAVFALVTLFAGLQFAQA